MNNTTYSWYNQEKVNDLYVILFEGILILPTVCGNILLLCSVCSHRSLKTRSHALIANLAVSDLLIGGIVLPCDVITKVFPEFKADKLTCLLHLAFFVGFVGASVTNLFVISLERYSAIITPLKHYTKASKTRLVLSVTIGWTVSITLGFLPLLGWNVWKPGVFCQTVFVYSERYIDLVLTFYLTMIITSIILYITVVRKILRQLHYYNKGRAGNHGNVRIQGNFDSSVYKNMKKTKTMILVLGVFAFCWGPFTILTILKAYFIPVTHFVKILEMYCTALGLLNCGLNWIIFGLMNNSMRRAFKNILFCSCNERIVVSSVSSHSNEISSMC